MMKDKKSYKFTSNLKRIGPKLKWFLFTEMQDLKLTSDYIDFICMGQEKNAAKESNPVETLRNLIEHALIREFTPKIKNLKSFNSLVDAIMYNIQKKSLQEDGDDDLEKLLED